jgi:hypothetical protein
VSVPTTAYLTVDVPEGFAQTVRLSRSTRDADKWRRLYLFSSVPQKSRGWLTSEGPSKLKTQPALKRSVEYQCARIAALGRNVLFALSSLSDHTLWPASVALRHSTASRYIPHRSSQLRFIYLSVLHVPQVVAASTYSSMVPLGHTSTCFAAPAPPFIDITNVRLTRGSLSRGVIYLYSLFVRVSTR